jgi:hypothetical protein
MAHREAISTMRPHVITGSIIAISALLAAAPVAAQLYKWVDENGVTNYSNQPPANPKAAKNLRPVEDRLSVYSPDEGLTQAIDDARQKSQQRQSQRTRIETLENQLEAERRAREQATVAAARETQLAYEKCVADRRVDCNAIYAGYPPYDPPVVILPNQHRRRHIPQAVLPPGTTAGNVTADNGFIPGNSAAAKNSGGGRREPRARRSPSEAPLQERR